MRDTASNTVEEHTGPCCFSAAVCGGKGHNNGFCTFSSLKVPIVRSAKSSVDRQFNQADQCYTGLATVIQNSTV